MPLCPACARRVPASVATCRCGHLFDAAETPVGDGGVAEPADAPERKSPPIYVVVAVFGALLIGMLFWINRDEPERSVSTPIAVAASTPPSRPGASVGRQAGSQLAVASASEPQVAADPAARVAAALAASRAAAAADRV